MDSESQFMFSFYVNISEEMCIQYILWLYLVIIRIELGRKWRREERRGEKRREEERRGEEERLMMVMVAST